MDLYQQTGAPRGQERRGRFDSCRVTDLGVKSSRDPNWAVDSAWWVTSERHRGANVHRVRFGRSLGAPDLTRARMTSWKMSDNPLTSRTQAAGQAPWSRFGSQASRDHRCLCSVRLLGSRPCEAILSTTSRPSVLLAHSRPATAAHQLGRPSRFLSWPPFEDTRDGLRQPSLATPRCHVRSRTWRLPKAQALTATRLTGK